MEKGGIEGIIEDLINITEENNNYCKHIEKLRNILQQNLLSLDEPRYDFLDILYTYTVFILAFCYNGSGIKSSYFEEILSYVEEFFENSENKKFNQTDSTNFNLLFNKTIFDLTKFIYDKFNPNNKSALIGNKVKWREKGINRVVSFIADEKRLKKYHLPTTDKIINITDYFAKSDEIKFRFKYRVSSDPNENDSGRDKKFKFTGNLFFVSPYHKIKNIKDPCELINKLGLKYLKLELASPRINERGKPIKIYEVRINLDRMSSKTAERSECGNFWKQFNVHIPTFLDRDLSFPYCPVNINGWGRTIDLSNGKFGLEEGVMPLPSQKLDICQVELKGNEAGICGEKDDEFVICLREIIINTDLNKGLNNKCPSNLGLGSIIKNSIYSIIQYITQQYINRKENGYIK